MFENNVKLNNLIARFLKITLERLCSSFSNKKIAKKAIKCPSYLPDIMSKDILNQSRLKPDY